MRCVVLLAVLAVASADVKHVLYGDPSRTVDPENVYKELVLSGLLFTMDTQQFRCGAGDSVYLYGHGGNGLIQGSSYIELMPALAQCDSVYLMQCCTPRDGIINQALEAKKLSRKKLNEVDGVFSLKNEMQEPTPPEELAEGVDTATTKAHRKLVNKYKSAKQQYDKQEKDKVAIEDVNKFVTWLKNKVKFFTNKVSNLVMVGTDLYTFLSPCRGEEDQLKDEEKVENLYAKLGTREEAKQKSEGDIAKLSTDMQKLATETVKAHDQTCAFVKVADATAPGFKFNDAQPAGVLRLRAAKPVGAAQSVLRPAAQ